MGFQTVVLDISMTKDEFVSLLITNCSLSKVSTDGRKFKITGSYHYTKSPTSNDRDQIDHKFLTILQLDNNSIASSATVNVHSEDDGKTYQGTVVSDIYPDNMSE